MSGERASPVASRADVATPNASRYLQQLCKHFAHKLEVDYTERTGQVRFSIGECRLRAQEDRLILVVISADDETLAQLQDVVERHLARFAFRETLAVAWRSEDPQAR